VHANTFRLRADLSLTAAERALLLGLTVLFERIVWMVQHHTELVLRTIDQSPIATELHEEKAAVAPT
jgi:hypothetical protein